MNETSALEKENIGIEPIPLVFSGRQRRPMKKVIKDRVLVCIISADCEVLIPNNMGALRDIFHGLDHKVLFFSSTKNPNHKKNIITEGDPKIENIDSHFIFEGLGYGELQKLAFHYSIKHNFDVVVVLHHKGEISK